MKHYHFSVKNIEELKDVFEDVFKEFPGKRVEISLWASRKDKRNMAVKVKEYIDENFRDIKGIREIADRFSYHSDTIGRRFKKKFGITLYQYIHQLKMEYAMHLLNEGYLVKQAAIEVGYKFPNHFSEALKRYKNRCKQDE